ncbi:formimidoylglutamase [Clostridium tepidiprofundi DSM 19306]|uniref:Formimidoylglutamase n=1 Tax=Clostridium tepidiprofundi DSM 19306 TaxID=1121338 RepID=A0A151B3Q3_9CLOT|nr:formimidoylglutamase [Clostridium tepidiprofundi]KYH34277.1 formimidoylglutamase [Clostridium tepidiprofundi DSM 19306]
MFNTNYKIANKSVWQGRIDSEDDFDAFRWHQWVKFIDLRKDDLVPFSGKLGFAFIGFCCDEGVRRNKGRTGASKGPRSIRKELANLPCRFSQEVKLFDAGNIYCENISLEECQALLSKAVKKILSLNLFPIVLGGGHEIAFGHYNGILNYLNCLYEGNPAPTSISTSSSNFSSNSISNSDTSSNASSNSSSNLDSTLNSNPNSSPAPKLGIINFDAHFDLRPYPNGGTSGTMFKQIADICQNKGIPYSYLPIGIQKHRNTVSLFKTADKLGVKYILANDVIHNDDWSILEKLDDFIKLQDHIYITICTDVFSSAYAPGVSATQPLGLEPEKILKFLKYILKSNKVISFDIAEVSPRFDQDNTTSNLASALIFTVINTLAKVNNLSISYV